MAEGKSRRQTIETSRTAPPTMAWQVGQPVEAKFGAQTYGGYLATKWYSGKIASPPNDSGACSVRFDDGDFESNVPAKFLRHPQKAAQPLSAAPVAGDAPSKPAGEIPGILESKT